MASREAGEFVFDLMEKFSGYGFNKSHSAPYALVAYQTAYLKANHPVEFLAASMTLDMGNTDKLNQFRQEAGRLGITMLPPDINRSGRRFHGRARSKDRQSGDPLCAGRGQGRRRPGDARPHRRACANGSFKDLFDFARRLDTKASTVASSRASSRPAPSPR
jgi:DNA polymerase-3 subunit alpha